MLGGRTFRRSLFVGVLICACGATSGRGQAPARSEYRDPRASMSSDLTLDSILTRLQSSLLNYRRAVPDLFCNERLRSFKENVPTVQSTSDGVVRSDETVTESRFRLRKEIRSDGDIDFTEYREIREIDGQPTNQDLGKVWRPVLLYGVFSDGLDIVTHAGHGCFEFKLHPIRKDHPSERIVIDFKTWPEKDRAHNCPQLEQSYGRVYVDPVSMHILRMEKNTPNHELLPGVRGLWTWSADYAPTTLASKVFWMPTAIYSKSTANNRIQVWTFDATYSDYRLFHADARIVPLSGEGTH